MARGLCGKVIDVDGSDTNNLKRTVKIEIDPEGPEEIIIRCRELTPGVLRLQAKLLSGGAENAGGRLSLYLGEEEHLVDLKKILYFETSGGRVAAHTDRRIYYTDLKLYELEEMLPKSFMRVSKASIINLDAVSWLKRELTGPCRVGFANCAKEVFISRMYYKPFREKLDETRMILK